MRLLHLAKGEAMRDISDEMLMAYADNELDGEGRALVDLYLSQDPRAADRLAVFISTGRGLGDVFDRPMREPVPQRLIDAVRKNAASVSPFANRPESANRPGVAGSGSGGQPSGAQVIDFRSVRRSRAQGLPEWARAAACVGVLAVGGALFWAQQSQTAGSAQSFGVAVMPDGSKAARQELAAALNTVASGTSVDKTIDGVAASIKPVFTFAAARGGYCRQYEITQADMPAVAGVACRAPDGLWQVAGQTALDDTTAGPGSPEGDTIQPAGKASSAAIDALVDGMISGDVLGLDDETRVIKNEWRAPDDPK